MRRLLDFSVGARALEAIAATIVDNLFREVAALRLGQKTWLSSGAAAVEMGKDTATPVVLEQEGTEAVDNGADTAAPVEVEHSVTAAVGLDADTADLAGLEPSVIERLGDMIFKCVRKTA